MLLRKPLERHKEGELPSMARHVGVKGAVGSESAGSRCRVVAGR